MIEIPQEFLDAVEKAKTEFNKPHVSRITQKEIATFLPEWPSHRLTYFFHEFKVTNRRVPKNDRVINILREQIEANPDNVPLVTRLGEAIDLLG